MTSCGQGLEVGGRRRVLREGLVACCRGESRVVSSETAGAWSRRATVCLAAVGSGRGGCRSCTGGWVESGEMLLGFSRRALLLEPAKSARTTTCRAHRRPPVTRPLLHLLPPTSPSETALETWPTSKARTASRRCVVLLEAGSSGAGSQLTLLRGRRRPLTSSLLPPPRRRSTPPPPERLRADRQQVGPGRVQGARQGEGPRAVRAGKGARGGCKVRCVRAPAPRRLHSLSLRPCSTSSPYGCTCAELEC